MILITLNEVIIKMKCHASITWLYKLVAPNKHHAFKSHTCKDLKLWTKMDSFYSTLLFRNMQFLFRTNLKACFTYVTLFFGIEVSFKNRSNHKSLIDLN